MKIIGIAGGIGSGKSVVSRILRLRGAAVYDCDLEAKRIMDESEEVLSALNARFGDSVCPAGGPINRKVLAGHVFNSDETRLWLNALVHRLVREDILRCAAALEKTGSDRFFVESAIIATSGLTSLCNEVWLVEASDEVRIARVGNRDGMTAAEIRARLRSQLKEEQLIYELGVAVKIIHNNPSNSLLNFITP